MIRKLFITHTLWVLVLFANGAQAAGTEGASNTYLGSGAGANLVSGWAYYNTFIGRNAGNAVNLQDGNTFVGFYSGRFTTANYNTFLGTWAVRILLIVNADSGDREHLDSLHIGFS